MYAIVASFRGPTDSRGARYVIRWADHGPRVTIPFRYESHDPSADAIREALRKPRFLDGFSPDGWRLHFGTLPNGDRVAVVVSAESVGEAFPEPDRRP